MTESQRMSEHRGLWAVVPVKLFARTKRRLMPLLAGHECDALARAMLTDVLFALTHTSTLAGVMVITGDPSQVDLPSGATSGLDDALRVLKGVQGTEQIKFSTSDIVRHALVGRIVAAYDKLGAKVKSLSQQR